MEYVDGTGSKLFVVFWHYNANYSEPDIISADTPEEAFERKYPFYANTKSAKFHRYAIEIQDVKNFKELIKV